MTESEEALVSLGRALKAESYAFTTPTPETLRRVNARPQNEIARSLADVFGWNRKFPATLLSKRMLGQLEAANALLCEGEFFRSAVRCSTLDGHLYFHSSYPTLDPDAVFFGPDTYRFSRCIAETLGQWRQPIGLRVIDIGCGSGAGGLSLLRHLRKPLARLVLADINPRCCDFASVNASLSGVTAEIIESDLYAAITGEFDLIVANPPYLVDLGKRLYRDGGGSLGNRLSLRIIEESLRRLTPGGILILYTGSAIEVGEDRLLVGAEALLVPLPNATWDYAELDPDVFGEELDMPSYCTVDRIAAVRFIVRRETERQ